MPLRAIACSVGSVGAASGCKFIRNGIYFVAASARSVCAASWFKGHKSLLYP